MFVVIAYYFPNWRTISIYWYVIPQFILTFPIIWVYESPKYLHEKYKYIECVNTLNKIAKWNKKQPIEPNILIPKTFIPNKRIYGFGDLFKYKSLRWITVASTLVFFAIQTVYYGVTFTMNIVGINLYVNTLIISGAELIAYLVTD